MNTWLRADPKDARGASGLRVEKFKSSVEAFPAPGIFAASRRETKCRDGKQNSH